MRQLDDGDNGHAAAAVRHHGILMLLAWGFVLPMSIACSVAFRYKSPDTLFFFRVHYIIAAVGVILAIAGWIMIGLNTKGSSMHGVLGAIVMCLAIVVVLLYPLMGKPEPESLRTGGKRIAAAVHTGLGYVIVALGWITCALGIVMTHDAVLRNAFFGCLASCLVFLGVLLLWIVGPTRRNDGTPAERRHLLMPK